MNTTVFYDGNLINCNKAPTNVEELLKLFNIESVKGIAISINENIIPITEYSEYIADNNIKIEIIKATQGG